MMNNDVKVIAFYLPQFHPIKENNEWFGEGFTEWTNVGKAPKLFKNHYQPRVPADLGYYDLRNPETREKQAAMAKEAGVSAFCYYHYWLGNGRQLMELPLQEIIRLKSPDFPFCLCWGNHSFYRKEWNKDTKRVEEDLLMEQLYPGDEDIVNHFNALLPAFSDKRYFRIDGRLVFVIYDPVGLKDFEKLKEIWNSLAKKNGLPEFYFITYSAKKDLVHDLPYTNYDAVILSLINNAILSGGKSIFGRHAIFFKQIASKILKKPLLLNDYKKGIDFLTDPVLAEENIIPTLVPNWDTSPRKSYGGSILHESTPELFAEHVRRALRLVKDKPQDKKILFLKSWNEWGEGNYMEPDLKFGKGYIKALRSVLDESL